MTCVQHEYESEDELEALSELEDESEWEDEQEDESESEAFYSRLSRLARRRPQSKALSRIAKRAARAASSSLADTTCDGESECEAEAEYEDEGEAAGEFEAGLNPIRRVYPDALMEHLGHAATETEDEAKDEAFIGALLPLAAKVLPKVGRAVMKATLHLAKLRRGSREPCGKTRRHDNSSGPGRSWRAGPSTRSPTGSPVVSH
jgi:hypothetical protein